MIRNTWKSGGILLAFLWAVSPMAQAQLPPGVSADDPKFNSGMELNRAREALERDQRREELREENKRIDEEERRRQEREKAAPSAPVAPPLTLLLKKVAFSPSTVLSESDLRAVAGKYEQKEVSLSDLYQMVEEVNQLYKKRGYITARALLTQQEIKEGVVKVLLVEGKVGSVKLKNNLSTNEDYILDRIDLPRGTVPNLNELDKQLQWFNGTNDAKLAIQLEAGKEAGTTDFNLTAHEPDRHQYTIMSDTAGRKQTGEFRAGLGYTNASVTGRRDSFSLMTLFSRSSQTLMLQYGAPINRKGTRLAAYYNGNRMKITEGDLNGFNIKGQADYFGVTLTHPIFSATRFKQDITLDIQNQHSSTTILGAKFVDDRIDRFSIGTGLTYYGTNEVYYFKPSYTQGTSRGMVENKDIKKLKADFFWRRQDRRENLYSVAVAAQKALTDFLPSSDQVYMGGMYSIRGYREVILSADSGVSMNLEARFPFKSPIDGVRPSALVFLDAGKLYGKNTLSTRSLASSGFGVSASLFKNSEITLTLGFPMKKKVLDEKVDSWRLHMGFNLRL